MRGCAAAWSSTASAEGGCAVHQGHAEALRRSIKRLLVQVEGCSLWGVATMPLPAQSCIARAAGRCAAPAGSVKGEGQRGALHKQSSIEAPPRGAPVVDLESEGGDAILAREGVQCASMRTSEGVDALQTLSCEQALYDWALVSGVK